MDSNVKVKMDAKALARLGASNVSEAVEKMAERANALSASFRTGRWHDPKTGKGYGNTQPTYRANTQDLGKGPIGIVYTGNYAAQKDNAENNTLLKSIR